MRIVAGRFRSRQLKPVRFVDLRPTSDRLRETLFNVLGPSVSGAVFLDCYAGTGAVGIEALSRGARQVIFVEENPDVSALILANLEALGVEPLTVHGGTGETQILTTGVVRGLARLAKRGVRADFLFADPTYAEAGLCVKALEHAFAPGTEGHLLGADATLVIEHATRKVLPEKIGHLGRTRVLKQGDSTLSFYKDSRHNIEASSQPV